MIFLRIPQPSPAHSSTPGYFRPDRAAHNTLPEAMYVGPDIQRLWLKKPLSLLTLNRLWVLGCQRRDWCGRKGVFSVLFPFPLIHYPNPERRKVLEWIRKGFQYAIKLLQELLNNRQTILQSFLQRVLRLIIRNLKYAQLIDSKSKVQMGRHSMKYAYHPSDIRN